MIDYYQSWRAGKVSRMHTMPQLHRENVAEHTWGILLAVCKFYPDASADFMRAVITHDAGEIATGDIPAHVKWANQDIARICEDKENVWLDQAGINFPSLVWDEALLLVVFDKVDFSMSCIHEMRLGNLNAARYYKRSYSKAMECVSKLLLSASPLYEIAEKLLDNLDQCRTKYLSHIPEYEYDIEC